MHKNGSIGDVLLEQFPVFFFEAYIEESNDKKVTLDFTDIHERPIKNIRERNYLEIESVFVGCHAREKRLQMACSKLYRQARESVP